MTGHVIAPAAGLCIPQQGERLLHGFICCVRAGKTTFIQNMFAAYSQDSTLPVNDASSPTAKDDFISAPEKLCTDITVRDEANLIAFHYRVQDSPGDCTD